MQTDDHPDALVGPLVDDDALSVLLRVLTHAVYTSQQTPERERGGGLGNSFGYGARFENSVFLMHPFCWCERDDCPWCAGCSGPDHDVPHREICYQTRLNALRQQFGTKESYGWHVAYDSTQAPAYEAAKRALCKELHRSYRTGHEVHCTCGADRERRRLYDACECDWHRGREPFRFGPATSAPNFWHKPTGLRVCWYKYIGRDNEVERAGGVDLKVVFEECLQSLGCSLESAVDAYAAAEHEAEVACHRSMETWAAFMSTPEGQAAMDELLKSSTVRMSDLLPPSDD